MANCSEDLRRSEIARSSAAAKLSTEATLLQVVIHDENLQRGPGVTFSFGSGGYRGW